MNDSCYKNNDTAIYHTTVKFMPKVLRWIGFNYSYDTMLLSDPIPKGDYYEYEVKLLFRWVTFFNYKLFKQKIKWKK